LKILLTSATGYGAWFLLRLMDEGHDCDYYLMDKNYVNVLSGIVPYPLLKKPDFSLYDLIIFDLTGQPKLAEEALKVIPVLGDSNLHSQLEDDRLFGIEVMEEVGINVPPYEVFSDISEAKRYIKKSGKKYVFKPFGGQDQDTASTYVSSSADDLLNYLDKLSSTTGGVDFLLQEIVEGTEVSVEGYFNGEDFFFINATLEEKKFMNDRKGPNTGCSGNLVWAFQREPRIFTQGLGKMRDWLAASGFRGMIDLNTIATAGELYGLEWTPRFGYDASATIFSLYNGDLGQFFFDIASGDCPRIEEQTGMFAAAVRISIPPYPTELRGKHPEGVPIQGLEEEDAKDYFLYDVMLDEHEELVTAGASGFICCPIGKGNSIEEAFAVVKERVKKLKIPDAQYRTDLYKCTKERYDILKAQGWL
jgi:phosphoribosylamine-glycine ligase